MLTSHFSSTTPTLLLPQDLLLLYQQIFSYYILCYAFRNPLLDFTVNPREFLLTQLQAH